MPLILVISTQVSSVVIERYRHDKMLVLTGTLINDDKRSAYAFFDKVVGYSLSGFFERNAPEIAVQVTRILERLLSLA